MSSNSQAEAWESFVRLIPEILAGTKNKSQVKANMANIKQACSNLGQDPERIFRNLSHVSSAICNQVKEEKSLQSEGKMSTSDDDKSFSLMIFNKASYDQATRQRLFHNFLQSIADLKTANTNVNVNIFPTRIIQLPF